MIDAALFLNQPSPRAWADSWQRRRGGQRATARRRTASTPRLVPGSAESTPDAIRYSRTAKVGSGVRMLLQQPAANDASGVD
jgi:hypothetical protein